MALVSQPHARSGLCTVLLFMKPCNYLHEVHVIALR